KSALLSLKNQLLTPKFSIVIDDGSKDKTPDILNEVKQDWNELYNNQSRQGLQIKRVVRSWNADLGSHEK
ncbi:MAG TPA: glycosyltransferase, partial [Nitrososphaeraceae archaeon]